MQQPNQASPRHHHRHHHDHDPSMLFRNMTNSLPSEWSLDTYSEAPLSSIDTESVRRGGESTKSYDDQSSVGSPCPSWRWNRSMRSTDATAESVSEINIANSVDDELVTTLHYKDNHFQVLDCSGKTGNRLHIRIIPFNNQRTYVEINHILVLDLARLHRIAAVLPCGTRGRSAVEIILDDGSPVVLQGCTPAIFAEAMVQLESHFVKQAGQAHTEISSVIDCYSYGTPGENQNSSADASLPTTDANEEKLKTDVARAHKPAFWRRLRK